MLVTGGAGFIGSHLVRALLARGDDVLVLDNLSTGARANLADLPVELLVADLGEADPVRAATRGVDTVFHLGAMISVPASLENPASCYRTNVLGSLHVLEAARRERVRRVVLASSCAVYGDHGGPVAEDDALRPMSPYASSKLAMEDLARLYTSVIGLQTVCLRFFNVYGPRQDVHSPYAAVIPLFIEGLLDGRPPTIHGDGGQSRDFVFVEDAVQAMLQASQAAVGGQLFNIGQGQSRTVLELAEVLAALVPGSLAPVFGPARAGDIRTSAADIGRATKALGYRPAWDLHQGLQATVEWIRAWRGPAPV
ncbi:MAG: Epimerase protein [Anaerolineales bacterium]|nr:Epimerase protein [Anaerolineales bacterium]